MNELQFVFVCMEHNDVLKITEGKYNYYMLCPKYYYENRGTDKACCNRISFETIEEIKDEIMLLKSEGQLREKYESETQTQIYNIISIRGNIITIGIKTKEGGKRINAGYI